MARDAPTSALNRLDLPTFGSPTIDVQPFAKEAPAPGVVQQRRQSGHQRVDRRRKRAGIDKMITLLGKIDRRLEARDQIEERRVDVRDRARQRAVELIEGRARLQRRRRLNQIGDRFGLHQIDPSIEKRAQRKLAGLRQARAACNRGADHRMKDHRAPVRAQLDDVVSRIRSGRRKRRGDDVIDRVHRPARAGHDVRIVRGGRVQTDLGERGVTRNERPFVREEALGDSRRARTTQTNDTNAAATRRRRDGDYGVGG